MERTPQKLIAPTLFVLLLLGSMGVVFGRRTEIFKEMIEEKYSIIKTPKVVAELERMVANHGSEELKKALLQAEGALQCQGEGQYCNTLTGLNCCSGIACVQGPIVGGVCHEW